MPSRLLRKVNVAATERRHGPIGFDLHPDQGLITPFGSINWLLPTQHIIGEKTGPEKAQESIDIHPPSCPH